MDSKEFEDAIVVHKDGNYEQAFYVLVEHARSWLLDESRGIEKGSVTATIGFRAGDKKTCQRSTLCAMTSDELRAFAELLAATADRMEALS